MSQSGSPKSNSSTHSDRDSPVSTHLPYSSHNKTKPNNKRYTNDTKTTSNTCNTKKKTNKVIHKKEDYEKYLTDESGSEHSDFDERNHEREGEDKCSDNLMDGRKIVEDGTLKKVFIIYVDNFQECAANYKICKKFSLCTLK